MQLPITIGLHRSFLGVAAVVMAHGLALIGIGAMPWVFPFKAGLIVVLVGLTLAYWRVRQPRVTGLRLFADGGVACRLAGDDCFLAAELVPGGTVHPWLTAIGLKLDRRKISVVVLPDCATPEDFRRLRIWLRWRADFSAGKTRA